MYLTSTIKIKRKHPAFTAVDAFCLLSKKLRNKVIWLQREEWKNNKGFISYQKFVFLPHKKFIGNLSYKCERFGIRVHTVNEAYTSKCSFIDDEEIGKHEFCLGKRVTTKFFVSKEGKKINADVNAAYNILKLSRGIKFSELDSRQVFSTPKVLKVNYGLNHKRPSHEL